MTGQLTLRLVGRAQRLAHLAQNGNCAFGSQVLVDFEHTTQGRAVDSMSPVERLCYVGNRAMGALEFEPMIKRGKNTPKPLEIEDLVQLADR